MLKTIGQIVVICLLALFFIPRTVSADPTATTRYVSKAGTDSGSCTPSSNACATIAYAKSQSFAADTILVGRSALDLDGVFNQSATIDFPLTIEGRFISTFPTVSWNACSGTACPTLTPPAGQSALILNPALSETITIRNLNFADSDGASAVRVQRGKAVLDGCRFDSNTHADDEGGALYVAFNADVTSTGCTFTGNSGGLGGAIYANGRVTLDDATFRLNLANTGGAIYSDDIFDVNILTVTNSLFELNSATDSGGAIRFRRGQTSSISGTDFFTNTAATEGGAVSLAGSQMMTISDGMMQGNGVQSETEDIFGGAISQRFGTVRLDNMSIRKNTVDPTGFRRVGRAGAIYLKNGTLTVMNSTLSDNASLGQPGTGDGIYVEDGTFTLMDSSVSDHGWSLMGIGEGSTTTMTVLRSTFNNNYTSIQAGTDATVTVVNSTVVTDENQIARAVRATDNGQAIVQYSTLFSPFGAAAGAENDFVGTFEIENSILSGQCFDALQSDLMDWDLNSIYNHDTCDGAPSNFHTNLGLAPLDNYGGPTETMYPVDGSPAINQGNQADCFGAEVDRLDQRGIMRPIGGGCDLGAVENDGSVPLAVSLSLTSAERSWLAPVGLMMLLLVALTGWSFSADKEHTT